MINLDLKIKRQKNYLKVIFQYFLGKNYLRISEGFDIGCGTGRWAKFVAPKVAKLHCIDPSNAIYVAKKNLKNLKIFNYYKRSLDSTGLKKNSQDFGYLLGVLHYVPDAQSAIISCSKLLKPGAPILFYIYYSLDNRPMWFRLLWKISNLIRLLISRMPKFLNFLICDLITLFIYYPLARIAFVLEKIGLDFKNFPLHFYRKFKFLCNENRL